MPAFNHDGIDFHYEDAGAGLPIIFQHGLGGDVTQPFGLFKPPAGARLLAFDARAHGRTQPAGDVEKLHFATFAEDLRALMDHLQIARAVIGGVSMGAGIALNFTLRFPQRTLGLVLSRPAWLDAPHPWNVQMFTLISGLIREHGAKKGHEMFKQTGEYRDTLRQWPDAANALALQFDNPQAEAGAIRLERIIKDAPCRDRRAWASIRVPTLVLANRLDPVHPYEFGEEYARLIPGAEFREIISKSVSVEQHGTDVQRELEEFFRRHFAIGG